MWIVSLLSMVPAVAWQLAWLMTAGATFFHFRAHGERFSYVDSRTGESREGVSIGALGVITLVFLLLSTYWSDSAATPSSPPRARRRARAASPAAAHAEPPRCGPRARA